MSSTFAALNSVVIREIIEASKCCQKHSPLMTPCKKKLLVAAAVLVVLWLSSFAILRVSGVLTYEERMGPCYPGGMGGGPAWKAVKVVGLPTFNWLFAVPGLVERTTIGTRTCRLTADEFICDGYPGMTGPGGSSGEQSAACQSGNERFW